MKWKAAARRTLAWAVEDMHKLLGWQPADLLRTVTHRTTSENICGCWQGVAERIWTEKTAV